MATICCVSDLHGNLPKIPDCDFLIIGGDIVPLWAQNQSTLSKVWLDGNFRIWLKELQDREIGIVGIAGNHDFIFEKYPEHVPDLQWIYLQDNYTSLRGLKIWGTPWQPYFGGWAFNLHEEQLSEKWDLIPQDTDIIIVHGPPYKHGDFVFYIKDGRGYEEM